MSLIDEVRENKELKRIFGERELKIIEKQLLGVKLKPSEIVRLSRDIRKKFNVVKELSKYEGEFALKKNSENKKKILEIKKAILDDELANEVDQIILFGSTIENENTLLSDLDIAVKFDDIDEKDAFRFRLRIARQFSNKIDIQVYNLLPEKIKKEIDKYRKIIYERK